MIVHTADKHRQQHIMRGTVGDSYRYGGWSLMDLGQAVQCGRSCRRWTPQRNHGIQDRVRASNAGEVRSILLSVGHRNAILRTMIPIPCPLPGGLTAGAGEVPGLRGRRGPCPEQLFGGSLHR